MVQGTGEIQAKMVTAWAQCKLEQNNGRGLHQRHNQVLGPASRNQQNRQPGVVSQPAPLHQHCSLQPRHQDTRPACAGPRRPRPLTPAATKQPSAARQRYAEPGIIAMRWPPPKKGSHRRGDQPEQEQPPPHDRPPRRRRASNRPSTVSAAAIWPTAANGFPDQMARTVWRPGGKRQATTPGIPPGTTSSVPSAASDHQG